MASPLATLSLGSLMTLTPPEPSSTCLISRISHQLVCPLSLYSRAIGHGFQTSKDRDFWLLIPDDHFHDFVVWTRFLRARSRSGSGSASMARRRGEISIFSASMERGGPRRASFSQRPLHCDVKKGCCPAPRGLCRSEKRIRRASFLYFCFFFLFLS